MFDSKSRYYVALIFLSFIIYQIYANFTIKKCAKTLTWTIVANLNGTRSWSQAVYHQHQKDQQQAQEQGPSQD